MFGIIGEDDSDVDTIKALIRNVLANQSVQARGHGCDGCANLLREGRAKLQAMKALGALRFIVSHDADGKDASKVREEVISKVVNGSGVEQCCVVIPTQEIESWILADIAAVTKIFPGWKPDPVPYPENIWKPRVELEKLSRVSGRRPRYSHATHNAIVAKHLSVKTIWDKCPSFRPLHSFILGP